MIIGINQTQKVLIIKIL